MEIKFVKPLIMYSLFFMVSVLPSSIYGQTTYLYGNYGYNFFSNNPYSVNTYSPTGTGTKIVSFGLAKGSLYQIGFGIKVIENIWFDINFSYVDGNKYETKSKYYFITYKAEGSFIQPSVYMEKNMEKYRVFLKSGLSIGFVSLNNSIYPLENASEPEFSDTYSGDIDFGFVNSFGISYKYDDATNIDFSFQYLSMYLNSSNVKDPSGHSYPTTDNPKDYSEKLSQKFPFNSLGFLIGVKRYF